MGAGRGGRGSPRSRGMPSRCPSPSGWIDLFRHRGVGLLRLRLARSPTPRPTPRLLRPVARRLRRALATGFGLWRERPRVVRSVAVVVVVVVVVVIVVVVVVVVVVFIVPSPLSAHGRVTRRCCGGHPTSLISSSWKGARRKLARRFVRESSPMIQHMHNAHCADHPTAKPFQHVRPRLPGDYRPYRCAPPRA